jgi:hypothetical protein
MHVVRSLRNVIGCKSVPSPDPTISHQLQQTQPDRRKTQAMFKYLNSNLTTVESNQRHNVDDLTDTKASSIFAIFAQLAEMFERVCIELWSATNAQKDVCQTFLRVLTIGKLLIDTTRWLQLQKKLQLEMRSNTPDSTRQRPGSIDDLMKSILFACLCINTCIDLSGRWRCFWWEERSPMCRLSCDNISIIQVNQQTRGILPSGPVRLRELSRHKPSSHAFDESDQATRERQDRRPNGSTPVVDWRQGLGVVHG